MSIIRAEHRNNFQLVGPPRQVPLYLVLRLIFSGTTLFGAAFWGVGCVFLIGLGSRTGVVQDLFLDWTRAEAPGQVIRLHESNFSENGRKIWRCEFQFTPAGQATLTGNSYTGYPKKVPAGANVPVEYSSWMHSLCRARGTRIGMVTPWVLFTGVFPLVGLLILMHGLKVGRATVRLLREGHLAHVEFIGAVLEERKTKAGGMKVKGEGFQLTLAAPSIDASPSDTPGEARRKAAWFALRIWGQGLAGILFMAVVNYWRSGGKGFDSSFQIFLGAGLVFMTLIALFCYWFHEPIAAQFRRKESLQQATSVEEFRQAQIDTERNMTEFTEKMRPVGMGCGILVALFLSAWASFFFGVLGTLAWVMLVRDTKEPGEFFTLILSFGIPGGILVFVGLLYFGWRMQAIKDAGLGSATPGDVVCTYRFETLAGESITHADNLPLPEHSEDIRPQLVLYAPGNVVRLFGLKPAVWIGAEGQLVSEASFLALIPAVFGVVLGVGGPLLGVVISWLLG